MTFKEHSYTVSPFIDYTKAKNLTVIGYEDLYVNQLSVDDIVIFCDIDRCNTKRLNTLKKIFEEVEKVGCRTMNNPNKVLRRFDLVNHLNSLNYNLFKVYRPQEVDVQSIRYPVFLRDEFEHNGPNTDLIYNHTELTKVIEKINHKDILITEFVNTSVDSLFHKYGAFIIDGEIIPRHYFISERWNVKSSSSITNESIINEIKYLNNNPHRELLQKISEITNIEYGRIDYSFLENQIVVFEINTNPTIIDQWDIEEESLRYAVTKQFVNNLTIKVNSMKRA
ncbi:hypothetical protein [Galbibacter sp. PAP.153]|uniref:hypothetical protein n=1 Tax=Galbibacter sp. PAP.153 TaxID=3104623 RepID=UPI0030085DBB